MKRQLPILLPLALVGLGMLLPWKYFDFDGSRIDHWGAQTLEAILFLLIAMVIAAVTIIVSSTKPKSRVAPVVVLTLYALGCAFGVLNLVWFAGNDHWSAGPGLYAQVSGVVVGLGFGLKHLFATCSTAGAVADHAQGGDHA